MACNHYTPPSHNKNKQQQASKEPLHNTDFGKTKNLRASKATGKVARPLAHAWPLQNLDAAVNPLRRTPKRAKWGGGGVRNGQRRSKTGPNWPPAPPSRPRVAPPHLQPAWLTMGHTQSAVWDTADRVGDLGVPIFGIFEGLWGPNVPISPAAAVPRVAGPETRFRGHFSRVSTTALYGFHPLVLVLV